MKILNIDSGDGYTYVYVYQHSSNIVHLKCVHFIINHFIMKFTFKKE